MAPARDVDRLLRRTRQQLELRSYSRRTVETYIRWVRRFLRAHERRAVDRPGKAAVDSFGRVDVERLGRADVERFLTRLAQRSRLAPKSRNQAASALAFFFRDVLGRDELRQMPRAREPKRVPSVLSHRQAMLVLGELRGKHRLLASLMYGAGLRLTEAHRLRIKDLDFDLLQITVRDGKGAKDRWVMLPDRLVPPLHRQIDAVRAMHAADLRRGAGWAPLPQAMARKEPTAGYDIGWQFLFPASRLSRDAATHRPGRAHLHPTAVQRAVKKAGRACLIPKPVTCHTLRRTFATQMLRAGYDVRTVQRIMGHKDVRTTMLYIEAITDTGVSMRSPLDQGDRRG